MIISIIGGFFWNRYLNKNNLIKKYKTEKNQEVYILGTLHKNHFNKWINYSMEDISSVVENIQPDVVFIEAREEYFKTYGVVDGPIDMTIVYSYCKENNIPTEMIDWWVVNNEFRSNSTNEKRDNMIFSNINNELKDLNKDTKVLVVCGASHLYEQSERFLDNGYRKMKLENTSELFNNSSDFRYPVNLEKEWEKRSYFYAYTYPKIIEKIPDLNDEVKSQFIGGNKDDFYIQQMKYCEIFARNQLYENSK